MQIRFTKMQGAGNDFVVLDETRGLLGLNPAQYRFLADRHFGVGADQILSVRPAPGPGLDFEYVIHNADGGEVEHCGNGARCFVRYVRDRGLTDKDVLRVETMNTLLELRLQADGRVTVDMNAPVFDLDRIPFDSRGLVAQKSGGFELWPLDLGDYSIAVAVLSITVASAGAAADGLGADAQALARAASRTTVLRRNRFILIPGNCGWGLRREIQLRREAVRGLQIGQAGGLAFDAGYRAGGARTRGQFRQQCQSGAVDGSDVGQDEALHAGQLRCGLRPQRRGRGAVQRAGEHQRVAVPPDVGVTCRWHCH